MGPGKNWIAGAVKHPGALHKALNVPKGQPIPHTTLMHAAQAPGKLGQMARMAKTLSCMNGK